MISLIVRDMQKKKTEWITDFGECAETAEGLPSEAKSFDLSQVFEAWKLGCVMVQA